MIEFTILGSGSGGNCAVIRTPYARLLVDAGLSASQLVARLADVGIDPDSLDGILITHEHCDHTRGLNIFTKKFRVPILANAMTREIMKEKMPADTAWKITPCGNTFTFAGMEIETFSVPHDAVDPMAFILRHGGVSLGVLSDLGHATAVVKARIRGVDALFIEANYDTKMLADDKKRPWSLKQRIASRHGHLSNEQTAELIKEHTTAKLQRIVLGHLSRDCNSPAAVLEAISNSLPHTAIPLSCASQNEPTPWFTVRPSTPAVIADVMWEQAMLF